MGSPIWFFFRIVLASQGPLWFYMNLKIGFSILAKKGHWEFESDCIESSNCLGEYCLPNKMRSSTQQIHSISPFI